MLDRQAGVMWFENPLADVDTNDKLYKLLQERRVLFILILLGILFYIDNIYLYVSANGIVFPAIICAYISFDLIGGYFPRKLSMIVMLLIMLALIYLIFKYTFLEKYCEQSKLHWGIFGEKISYCTIKRMIYQSILSLSISASVATLLTHMR